MKITLLSPVHLWVNPRLVKEADALTEAGHSVWVISTQNDSWSAQRDAELYKRKKWKWTAIRLTRSGLSGRWRWFSSALKQKLFFKLSYFFPYSVGLAERAYCRGYSALLRQAIASRADYYIAHTQAVLGIAARAALKNGVRFGFDCEDLNAEAAADGGADARIKRNIETIEKHWLARAQTVTATSLPMAEYLEKKYSIPKPKVVHNVFSRSELSGIEKPAHRPMNSSLSMVWMSATIGRGRNLEAVVGAMKDLPSTVKLTVYGRFIDPNFERELKSLAGAAAENRILFCQMPSPWDVMKTISKHDVGLAMDDGSCLNLALTVCNKFFLYLQCGLAVAATSIEGQKSIFKETPGIGFMVASSDRERFKQAISNYARDPQKLLEAKSLAWEAGQTRFNWDQEKIGFLDRFINDYSL